MSFNQSRFSDKSDSQYRKSDRSASFNQQRTPSGSTGRGGGGGGGQPAPSPSIAPARSFKKSNNNAHGGQRAVNSSQSSNPGVPNGGHVPPQFHGPSVVPVTSIGAKQPESVPGQRSSRAVPKAPTSQHASLSSDTTAPTTPLKATGGASKAFPFQFGSISPGFMNGMQIPARTSSAPPNLVEQQRDQACHDTVRSATILQVPSTPKPQAPRKEAATVDQSNAREPNPLPKAKRETQISSGSPSSQTQKSTIHPMTGISMPMPFHQPQVQYGGQIQSQGMTSTSLQMPMAMPLPMGNVPHVQQQVFVPGLQPHSMQAQGIMRQGQGLGFTTQMGPQLAPQLGNLGIGMSPQYQQGGKFGGQRKTPVKITHPDTHEELRLDKRTDTYSDGGSSASKSLPNGPQSRPIPSFRPSHSLNYYPNSYKAGSMFVAPPSSHPTTSSQMTPNSQALRYSYSSNQGPHVSFMNAPGLNPVTHNKIGVSVLGVPEPPNLEHPCDVHNPISSTSAAQVIVKPAGGSIGKRVAESLPSSLSAAVEKGESPMSSRPSEESNSSLPQSDSEVSLEISLQQPKSGGLSLPSRLLPVATEQPVSAKSLVSGPGSLASVCTESLISNTEGRSRETLSRFNSIKDQQRKPEKKSNNQSQHQIGGESTSTTSLTSRALEHGVSSNSEVSNSSEAKTTLNLSAASGGVLKSCSGSLSSSSSASPIASESKVSIGEGSTSVPSKLSCANNQLKPDSVETEEPGNIKSCEGAEDGATTYAISPQSTFSELIKQAEKAELKATTLSNEVRPPGTAQRGLDEPLCSYTDIGKATGNLDTLVFDSFDAKTLHSGAVLPTSSHEDKSASTGDNISIIGPTSDRFAVSEQQSTLTSLVVSEATLKDEGESVETVSGGMISLPVSGSKDKPTVELQRTNSTTGRSKKKRKEILQKADAAGTTADLYMAYKGHEEKKENIVSLECTSNKQNSKQTAADVLREDNFASEKSEHGKTELDDWEDAADIFTPKLVISDNEEHIHGRLGCHDYQSNILKKYSRDFLLKFAEQCTEFPDGFEITSDISDVLISANVNITTPGRIIDRPSAGPRPDRRGSGIVDDDRWNKVPVSFGPGRMDISHGGNAGFRPNQGGNYGVLRNPRGQAPLQYAGGILTGPMQSLGSQGGMLRNSPDAERWQRGANFQHKGLIPSPQTPLQMMHKAERKYEVGKITDEEEAKQRQLKAILNKLTPQNFEKLVEQVKAVNIDNAGTLTGVISQIFDKALTEPTFCEMYASFCHHLAGELPYFSDDNEKITFKRILLNKCQEEFERGEREQEEADKADEEGEAKLSEGAREEKRVKARRRMLGNIRLIGELYKKKMLTDRIMHECITKLLGQNQNPDEEDIEALCKLMSTIGEMIDHPKAKEHMDAYFDMMSNLSNNMKISSRVRFMLKDSIDLRKNKWQQRRKVEGPKKIEEVHRDAAQERQAQTSRLARGSAINASARRGAPKDFGPRGSTSLSSPSSQMGGFRGMPTQARVSGAQDVRSDDRQSYEARILSVPLPHRRIGDVAITLGPQGGLARGMSIRGPPLMSSGPLSDFSSSTGDSRRMAPGLNGYNPAPERTSYNSREDPIPRYVPDRLAGPAAYDQSGSQERHVSYYNKDTRTPDLSFERSVPTVPQTRQVQTLAQDVSSEKKVWPEDRLRDMSMAAIKEFYSARDEKEVALCIKDLNSPSFHPKMISLWVTDSFEMKDKERDLLANLLVNLSKSGDCILSEAELIKGFESALTSLEDAVNDAPRAPEFLGRIFAKVVMENVVSLREVGKLIHEGGEEPGSLLKVGLAEDVLGSTLEMINSEKGESVLNDLCKCSNLCLETFKPPDLNRSGKLDKFIRG